MNMYALISNPLVVALAALIIGFIGIVYIIATTRTAQRRAAAKQREEAARRDEEAANYQTGFNRIRREEETRK